MKKTKNQKIVKLSSFEKFFYKSVGADIEILSKCSYSIRVMYFCLGGIVLASGVLAFLSGSYAVYTVFSPKSLQSPEDISWIWVAISVVLGSFFGYLIFNLERYIVSSTGKGDGTDDITWKELKNSLPRILLSVIIAITVSKPLEIRIFQSEIDAVLNEKRIEYRDKLRLGVDKKYIDRIEKLETDKDKLETERKELIVVRDALQGQYVEEARIVTVGPRARAMLEEVNKKQLEINNVDEQIKKTEAELVKVLEEREKERAEQEKTAVLLDGLLERIKISHEIGGMIPWFITALFMVLDVTPIFFKMMLLRNTYDYLKENDDRLVLAYEGIQTRPGFYGFDAEGNTVDATTYHAPEQIEREKVGIYKRQNILIDKIIKMFFDREETKVDTHLDDYIIKSNGQTA